MVEEFHLAVDTRPQDPGAGVFKSECGGRDVFYRNASKRGHVAYVFWVKVPTTEYKYRCCELDVEDMERSFTCITSLLMHRRVVFFEGDVVSKGEPLLSS